MEDAGQKLKRARERLGLRYRDVEEYSQQIAERRKNSEYAIAISRLSDIENRGVVPTVFKLYSLCAIYRLDFSEALSWYGVPIAELPGDAMAVGPERSHSLGFSVGDQGFGPAGSVQVPLALDPGLDLSKTTFLSRLIQSWGVLPLMLLSRIDVKSYRYGFIGMNDWFMYPLLHPGSLVLVDETRRKIAAGGWTSEYDRPIYFIEHREGWLCGWAAVRNGNELLVLPHPASPAAPVSFPWPGGADLVGQVVGVANRIDPDRRPPARS
jgi:transcriptional regulator with XRE-family HTH domain